MNNLIPVNNMPPTSVKDVTFKLMEHFDSKDLLILGSMACFATVICVACVSFSGSEMTLSKNGLSIKQPIPVSS